MTEVLSADERTSIDREGLIVKLREIIASNDQNAVLDATSANQLMHILKADELRHCLVSHNERPPNPEALYQLLEQSSDPMALAAWQSAEYYYTTRDIVVNGLRAFLVQYEKVLHFPEREDFQLHYHKDINTYRIRLLMGFTRTEEDNDIICPESDAWVETFRRQRFTHVNIFFWSIGHRPLDYNMPPTKYDESVWGKWYMIAIDCQPTNLLEPQPYEEEAAAAVAAQHDIEVVDAQKILREVETQKLEVQQQRAQKKLEAEQKKAAREQLKLQKQQLLAAKNEEKSKPKVSKKRPLSDANDNIKPPPAKKQRTNFDAEGFVGSLLRAESDDFRPQLEAKCRGRTKRLYRFWEAFKKAILPKIVDTNRSPAMTPLIKLLLQPGENPVTYLDLKTLKTDGVKTIPKRVICCITGNKIKTKRNAYLVALKFENDDQVFYYEAGSAAAAGIELLKPALTGGRPEFAPDNVKTIAPAWWNLFALLLSMV